MSIRLEGKRGREYDMDTSSTGRLAGVHRRVSIGGYLVRGMLDK